MPKASKQKIKIQDESNNKDMRFVDEKGEPKSLKGYIGIKAEPDQYILVEKKALEEALKDYAQG